MTHGDGQLGCRRSGTAQLSSVCLCAPLHPACRAPRHAFQDAVLIRLPAWPSQPRARSCIASSEVIRSQRAPARADWGATWVRAVGFGTTPHLCRSVHSLLQCSARCCCWLPFLALQCSRGDYSGRCCPPSTAILKTAPKAPAVVRPAHARSFKLAPSLAPVCLVPCRCGGRGRLWARF